MVNRDKGDVKLRRGLFQKNRKEFKRLRSQKGASVIFALVGFMFAAMISFVVINAAYSASTRVKKLKYDEQSFLLAQSMSGIITDALAGSGAEVVLPNGDKIDSPEEPASPEEPKKTLKYDGLSVTYQYIEEKKADGTIDMFYNKTASPTVFDLSTGSGDTKETFYEEVIGKSGLTDAGKAVRNMIRDMAKKVDRSKAEVTETLVTADKTLASGETLRVETQFTMSKSYSINAITTATVTKGSNSSTYVVRMDASAAARTDKFVCVGTRNNAGNKITVNFDEDTIGEPEDDAEDEPQKELVKVSCYSVTWPADQMRSVYLAPPTTP